MLPSKCLQTQMVGGTILSPAGYKHSQMQMVRRPSLDILLALTWVNRGWGLSQCRGCALCGNMATLASIAGQAKGEELGSGLLEVCPHVGRWAPRASEVAQEMEEV